MKIVDEDRIKKLKENGYDVMCYYDGSPSRYGWFHPSSGASQAELKHLQPLRTTEAQAWSDCDAYYSLRVPDEPEMDWNATASE